ncbi:MAG TPA: ATP-binding protein, partial [Phormidium sp.]
KDGVKTLLSEKGGEWVLLQAQDIKPLLAILFVYENQESYDLSEEEIIDFIQKKRLAIDNPLIREILSDPSGQEPENLIDEDMPVSIPQTVSDSVDSPELNI